jgi:predicted glycosyltransferase
LATGVPALVLPYSRQQEQPLRVDKIKAFLPLVVLTEADLQAARMSELIAGHLARGKRAEPAALNLDGAANTARFIESWADPAAAT